MYNEMPYTAYKPTTVAKPIPNLQLPGYANPSPIAHDCKCLLSYQKKLPINSRHFSFNIYDIPEVLLVTLVYRM